MVLRQDVRRGAASAVVRCLELDASSIRWEIAQTSSTSPDLEIPKWIVYMCIPLGSYLMCFRFLQVAYHFVRHDHLPHHDHSHVEGVDEPHMPGSAAAAAEAVR